MVKDQEFLEKKASYCLGLAKKLGATDSSVIRSEERRVGKECER